MILREKTQFFIFHKLTEQAPLFRKIVVDLGLTEKRDLCFNTFFYLLSIFWSANLKNFPNFKKEFVLIIEEKKQEPGFLVMAENAIYNQVDWGSNKAIAQKYIAQIKCFNHSLAVSVIFVLWSFTEFLRFESEQAIAEAGKIVSRNGS
jgi:hypothetical protein